MPKLEVAPTRSNLLKTRESLVLAREGYDLLEQKREVLLMELMQIVHDLRELERQVEEKSADAFTALESALLSMGNEAVQWSALSVTDEQDVTLLPRSVMGIPVITLQAVEMAASALQTSPMGTSPALDEVRRRFGELLPIIYRWGEIEISVWRLAGEIRKTQRRVNALENIFIPEYEDTVKAIEDVLEENDREEFIRKKKVKSVLKRKRSAQKANNP